MAQALKWLHPWHAWERMVYRKTHLRLDIALDGTVSSFEVTLIIVPASRMRMVRISHTQIILWGFRLFQAEVGIGRLNTDCQRNLL